MEYQQSVVTDATPQRVWAALAGVTELPRWAASVTSVTPLDGAQLVVGRRFRIRQRGLPPMVWTVEEVREGESYTWVTRAIGVRTSGYHRMEQQPDGPVVITLGLSQSGPLAGLVARLIGAKIRRFMTLEAAGLKAAAEAVG
jgi:uncharacterized protein YndB with AHSA1/START domain